MSAVVVGLWVFPSLWYSRSVTGEARWLTEVTNVAGWKYTEIPVDKSAERVLVADRLVNGEFTNHTGGGVVRVFLAKRYSEKPHDIGLFVHTPDRCWTEGGWKMEPTIPDAMDFTVHGIPMTLERRIFVAPAQRELVYFGGLVGGQPLPYRLDHNISVGMRVAAAGGGRSTGHGARASDSRFWERVWDSFVSRRPLLGPKQFIRISTSVSDGNIEAGERRIREMLELWLTPRDFREEIEAWSKDRAT
jgi:hypothetical protein